jgi:RNA polymerase sigma-70 factor, ECF subfamily
VTMEPRVGPRRDRQPLSDAEQRWLQAFRSGNSTAFQPLVRPHLPALLALARRHCADPHWAEDLLQEVLVRAFRGLPGFRGEAALRTWLFRILVRLAADPSRWRLDDHAVDVADFEIPDHLEELPEQGAISRELWQRLDEAMERLTLRQRTALHLRAVEGMDYAGIAAVLECSKPAARMLVLEARRKVLRRLGEHLEP